MENRQANCDFELKLITEPVDVLDDNIDAEVALAGGERYAATFATVENIRSILSRYKNTEECLSGSYFWCVDLIIVQDLNADTLDRVVADLLASGELFKACTRLLND